MSILVDGLISRTGFAQYNQQEAMPGRLMLVPDPLGIRGNVLRAQLVAGDIASGSERAELSLVTEDSPATSMRWYAFSTLLESAQWDGYAGNQVTIYQCHDREDVGDAPHRPPLELCIYAGGYWSFRIAGANEDPVVTSISVDLVPEGLRLYPMDRWVDWVIQVQYGFTGTGGVTVWMDRRKFALALNKYIGYDAAAGAASKCGLYCPLHMPSGTSKTSYHTGIIVGDAYSTFDEFMAACGSSDTELEGFAVSGVSL